MRKLLSAVLVLQAIVCFGSNNDSISQVRLLYSQAATEESSCRKLLVLLEPYSKRDNALLYGYKGAATMMLAKYAFNPLKKLAYFRQGRDLLESAIEVDGNNFELRFLRFAAQTSIPSFLNYNKNIVDDKRFLLRELSSVSDPSLRKLVIPFLKESRYLTDVEKEVIAGQPE